MKPSRDGYLIAFVVVLIFAANCEALTTDYSYPTCYDICMENCFREFDKCDKLCRSSAYCPRPPPAPRR